MRIVFNFEQIKRNSKGMTLHKNRQRAVSKSKESYTQITKNILTGKYYLYKKSPILKDEAFFNYLWNLYQTREVCDY